ncbi:FkbM family methyltransferase [Salinibacter ruber]|nr:FkbM family methyltransferase [Salinibacter ruber]
MGGFPIAASKKIDGKVFSVEPSSQNYKCLLMNLGLHCGNNSISPINKALGESVEHKKINLTYSGCDDSIIKPNSHDKKETENIKVTTLKKLVEMENINEDNLFVKIEAKRYEPEIVKRLGSKRPNMLTVDVTPERNKKSPKREIKNLVFEMGYTNIINTERCIFAKR